MSCEYCDGSKNQTYLLDKNDSALYIDRDKKVICFEHVHTFNKSKDVWDCEDEILYREAPIELCPKCGDKL